MSLTLLAQGNNMGKNTKTLLVLMVCSTFIAGLLLIAHLIWNFLPIWGVIGLTSIIILAGGAAALIEVRLGRRRAY